MINRKYFIPDISLFKAIFVCILTPLQKYDLRAPWSYGLLTGR